MAQRQPSLLVVAVGGLRCKCRITEHVDGASHRDTRVVAQLQQGHKSSGQGTAC